MPDLTRASNISPAVMLPPPNCQIKGTAAVDLTAGDMVYLTSTGTLAKTNGTANNALAQWAGMVTDTAKAGQPATAYHSIEIAYGSGFTPGANVYVSATAGALSDAATTGGDVPCGKVLSANTILIFQPRK